MISFTVTIEGASALSQATASNPVLIDSITLYSGETVFKTITDFSGAVADDGTGIGEYVVVRFDDTTSSEYTVTRIGLLSSSTLIAYSSDTFSVNKPSNKHLSLRITAQFTGAGKCSFNSVNINLPYATTSRDGVIRLAKPNNAEQHKDRTVYSAQEVESLIESGVSGAGKFVPWDTVSGSTDIDTGSTTVSKLSLVDDYDNPTDTATLVIDSNGYIETDTYISGTAVESTPHFATSSGVTTITDTVALVNGSYIASLYTSAVDTSVAQSDANKLVSSGAVKDYVETTLDGNGNNYVHKTGDETIAGAKIFSGNIVANSTISGTAVYSSYVSGDGTGGWENSGSASKLPTVAAVAAAITDGDSAVTTAFQTADNNLQSQIDGINAGQNLADIVDTKGDLVSHSLTDLKARGDYKSGDSGPTWAVGDKIQVLHDKTKSDGTYSDDTAPSIATVYELVKGTVPSGESAKSHASSTTGYYWHYIGEYGVDSYTKSETDSLFVQKTSIAQSVTDGDTTSVPSSDAVYDHVASAISTAGGDYVKLTSATSQTIASPLVIKETSSSSPQLSIPDGQTLSSNSTLTVKSDNTTASVSSVYDLTNTAYTVKLGSNTALDLRKTSTVADASGDLVASYRDSSITNGTLSDGRLVTVDYLTHFTGDMSAYAKVQSSNDFTNSTTPTTNQFDTVSASSYSGSGVQSSTTNWNAVANYSKLPTVEVVSSALDDLKSDTLDDISSIDAIGSIGLFLYTEVDSSTGIGVEKAYGTTVSGAHLKPVGMSLPLSGQISYKAVATASPLTGTWTLLSVAVRRTSTEPCLVLAQKTSN